MKKTNNKGFSLVELIIVVAIMAILIGVLAPQYMKYVEKSRVSADKDLLNSIYNAMSIALGDPDVDPAAITYGTAGTPAAGTVPAGAGTAGTGYTTEFWEEVFSTLAVTGSADLQAKLKSKIYTGATSSDIHYEVDEMGNFTVYIGTKNGPEDYKQGTAAGITVGAGVSTGGTAGTTP